nr:NifB/NifX family molybdenum-iron cluster-binding protein [candidate division Zixibacteria bacterium]
MRIAVSSQGKELSSRVDPRFGRAAYFIIFDTSDSSVEAVENSQNVNAAQGAGIQAARNVAGRKVDLVVSGNFGPKAFATLNAAGIKAAQWADGTVAQAIEMARNNELKVSTGANVEGHWM